MSTSVRAVIWDFDNTLVDTRAKNISLTRKIIEQLTGDGHHSPVLASVESYERALHRTRNWRDLYETEFGLDEETIDIAGRMWTELHRADETKVHFYAGVATALRRLSHVPHGIVSQSSRLGIRDTLETEGLNGHFDVVIGYEEVHLRSQKPAPDGLLDCVERLVGSVTGIAIYVGDHDTDVECAANANAELERRSASLRIMSVGADYGRSADVSWNREPHHRARRPEEVVQIVRKIGGDPSARGTM